MSIRKLLWKGERRSIRPDGKSRRGYLMLELATAVVVLGVMMGVCLQAIGWVLKERRSIDRRAVALQEAANLLDEFTALPWPQLTPQRAQACQMSAEAAAILPRARVDVALAEPAGEPPARRITVTLHWQGDHGQDEGPLRLTAWVYRHAEAER